MDNHSIITQLQKNSNSSYSQLLINQCNGNNNTVYIEYTVNIQKQNNIPGGEQETETDFALPQEFDETFKNKAVEESSLVNNNYDELRTNEYKYSNDLVDIEHILEVQTQNNATKGKEAEMNFVKCQAKKCKINRDVWNATNNRQNREFRKRFLRRNELDYGKWKYTLKKNERRMQTRCNCKTFES